MYVHAIVTTLSCLWCCTITIDSYLGNAPLESPLTGSLPLYMSDSFPLHSVLPLPLVSRDEILAFSLPAIIKSCSQAGRSFCKLMAELLLSFNANFAHTAHSYPIDSLALRCFILGSAQYASCESGKLNLGARHDMSTWTET